MLISFAETSIKLGVYEKRDWRGGIGKYGGGRKWQDIGGKCTISSFMMCTG
jgi:hypothetical protein